jgi:hypothetical protein
MDDAIEFWDDATDVAEYTGADFEGRRSSIPIWDDGDFYRDALEYVGEAFDCSPHLALDVSVRLYLAHISDENGGAIHDAFDQTRLIPPRGWVEANVDRLPSVDVPLDECGGCDESGERDAQYNPGTAETVTDMVRYACDEMDIADGPSQFAMKAVTYVVSGYSDDGSILHSRETVPLDAGETAQSDEEIISHSNRPLPLSALTQTKNQRDLLDYFLSVQLPEEGVSKTKMAEQSGVSANGIRRHIDVFLDFDIVELTTSEDARFTRYTTTDNEVHDALVRANNVLAAHYSSNANES